MHAFPSHAFSTIRSALCTRGRATGLAAAAGMVGAALLVVPALAQTGNQAPHAGDDAYAVVQNTATSLAVLGNDTDAESDALTIQSVSTPGHGTAVIAGAAIMYTPATGYTGADAFTYVVSDGHGNTDVGTVTLVVAATVGVPVANDDTANVPMNTATSIPVLTNDTDPDGHALTVTAVSTPTHGTATITGTAVTYTPAAGYTGVDAFSYTVSDGFGSADLANVVVTVTPTGNAPVAQNDSANARAGTPVVLHVLGNDSDPNGDALTVIAVTTPAHGSATITGGARTVTYTGAAGYTGADSFSYTVSDGHGGSATAMVAIVVVPQDALLARNDTASTRAATSRTIAVLANDVASSAGAALTVTAVTTPAHGTAVITGDAKRVTYTPAAGYTGTDAFLYTVTEAGGGSTTATVTVTVRATSADDDADDEDDDGSGKDRCREGRWVDLGFRNQGLCIAAVNHGFMENGEPIFPHGIFPHGIFPHGIFPNGVFGDDGPDDGRASRREERRLERAQAKRARLEGTGALIGESIRESVRASIEASLGKPGKGRKD